MQSSFRTAADSRTTRWGGLRPGVAAVDPSVWQPRGLSTGTTWPLDRARISPRAGKNVASSGQECRLDRARISPRPGADVRSSGQECRVERARMSPQPGVHAASTGQISQPDSCAVRLPTTLSLQNQLPLHVLELSTRRGYVSARSPPTRPGICARSAVHLRPLDRTFAPARRCISAHSTGHLRPLERGQSVPRSEGRLTTIASWVLLAITTTASRSGALFSSRCGVYGGTKT
jgi:hypothetical protein